MKIAVSGGKGGTGKSVMSTSMAVQFAKKRKTMLIDADVECPNDHLMLSVERKVYTTILQPVPKWDFGKCTKCGKCADICKQNAIVFVKDKYPAFVKDVCMGCKACLVTCPEGAITETTKEIGTVHTGKNYGVELVSGELKLGELASGEIVAELRKHSDEMNEELRADVMIIDTPAGIGCPVIAAITGTDYVIAVTEPTPSALHDLKRVVYLANHFKIRHGIVINKYDMAERFCSEIEKFAEENNIPIIGRVPYSKDFVEAMLEMKPVAEKWPKFEEIFEGIIKNI